MRQRGPQRPTFEPCWCLAWQLITSVLLCSTLATRQGDLTEWLGTFNKKLKDLVPIVEKAERALKTLRTMMKHDTVNDC